MGNKTVTIGGEEIPVSALEGFPVGADYPEEGGMQSFKGWTPYTWEYSGPDEQLKGQSAMVYAKLHTPECYAQFNKVTTRKCFGWWKFNINDFGFSS